MKTINYLRYRLKWHFATYFNFKSPVHIDIELNNNCNQSCLFCWHSSKKLPFDIDFMSNLNTGCIFNYCINEKVKSVKFNWRGEPLIDIERLSLLSYLFQSENIYTMINTNGKKLKDNITKLSHIDEIIISVDSLKPKIYELLHNDSLKIIISLLRKLLELKDRNLLESKIKLNFHQNELNDLELRENLDYYKMIMPFKIISRYTEKREGEDISIERERKRKKICPHMKRRLTVASNGKIFPCCVAYNEPEDLLLGYDIDKAWNSHKRIKLIENYKRGIFTETCKNCTSGDVFYK